MTEVVKVKFTMTFTRTFKHEWCEHYDIDPNDPQWASKMAMEDVKALNEDETSPDEFFDGAETFDATVEIDDE